MFWCSLDSLSLYVQCVWYVRTLWWTDQSQFLSPGHWSPHTSVWFVITINAGNTQCITWGHLLIDVSISCFCRSSRDISCGGPLQYQQPVTISESWPVQLRREIKDRFVHLHLKAPSGGTSKHQLYGFCFTLGGNWVHTNSRLRLKNGDTVYYWIYQLINGVGYQITDQKYVSRNASCLASHGW